MSMSVNNSNPNNIVVDNNDNNNDNDVDDKEISYSTYFGLQFDKFFTDNIPVDIIKELPFNEKYVFGTFIFLIFLSSFLYFAIKGFDQALKAKFVSMSIDAGNCELVYKPLDGTYLASVNGFWQGEVLFNYSDALFQFSFFNLQLSYEDFAQGVLLAKDNAQAYMQLVAPRFNLALLLIALSTYQQTIRVGETYNSITYTASPFVIYHRRDIFSGLATSSAACNLPCQHAFDSATAIFTLAYPATSFETYCAVDFVPFLFSYYGDQSSGPDLVINLDMRSFVSAFARNINVPGVREALELVPNSQTINSDYELNVVVDGINFFAQQMFNFRYPGMSPILCLSSTNSSLFKETPICFVPMQNLYGLPIANHQGASATYPTPCNCSLLIGQSDICNQFNLMSGLILNGNYSEFVASFNQYNTLLTLVPMIELAIKYARNNGNSWPRGALSLNEDAFRAQFSVSYGLTNRSFAEGSFDFCGFNCTILSVLASDIFNQGISDYYYQLVNGSCQDSISFAGWDQLAVHPPAALTEIYYSCVQKPGDALLNSVGVAQGTVSLLMTVLGFVMLPIAYWIMRWKNSIPIAERYDDEERSLVLKEFANLLLTARDRNLAPGQASTKENQTNVFRQIVEEMMAQASRIERRNTLKGKSVSVKKRPSFLNKRRSVEPKSADSNPNMAESRGKRASGSSSNANVVPVSDNPLLGRRKQTIDIELDSLHRTV